MKFYGLIILLLFNLFAACDSNKRKETDIKDYINPTSITVSGDRFVDNFGRHVILNGINVVSKSKEEQYIFQSGPEFYSNMKTWGFNCIRFYICWDGLEPEPGVYNEQYLKEIDTRIQWAGDHGLFVVLDMHQDLFGVKFGNGAPEWAIFHEDKPHETGVIWSDSYLLSEAVQTSFDNFWANKEAHDGIGIQDHYANLWRMIAKRYAGNHTVIGYDIMNEPFPGSSALQYMPALLTAYGNLVFELTGEILSEEELQNNWGNEENRTEVLRTLSSKENYARVIDVLYDFNSKFENTHLQQMHQKVSYAIREVDTNHILFLEHSYFSNTGVKSSIERVLLADGNPDTLLAYAPHGYDMVTDTKDVAAASSERVAFIYDRIKEKGAQLNMPVWLGEWGAYYSNAGGIVPTARVAIGLIEKHLFGNAYWSYDPGTENLEYFQKALLRPFPVYTCGELICYTFDYESSVLSVEWEESVENTSPTVIYVPWISRINHENLNDFGPAAIDLIDESDSGWIIIHPAGNGGKRNLVLQFEQ